MDKPPPFSSCIKGLRKTTLIEIKFRKLFHWGKSCSLNWEKILSLTAVVPEFFSQIFAVSFLSLLSSMDFLGLWWLEFVLVYSNKMKKISVIVSYKCVVYSIAKFSFMAPNWLSAKSFSILDVLTGIFNLHHSPLFN